MKPVTVSAVAAMVALLLALPKCSGRPRSDAGARRYSPDTALAADVVSNLDVAHTTRGDGASGPWRASGAGAYAASPSVWSHGAVYSVMAAPTEDLRRAELQLLRWSDAGALVIAHKEVSGMAPGATLALDHTERGLTVLWLPAITQTDGGATEPRAQDLSPNGFVGQERPAEANELNALEWVRAVSARRARTGADEPAPVSLRGGVSVRAEARGPSTVVIVDGVEVTRGSDLAGYERALGGAERGTVRWVGLSRGRCADARIEVYKVQGRTASLRASFPIGEEIGVRWIALDPQQGAVALSWYQDYIPIRVECGRTRSLSRIADHGLRVALVREP